MPLALLGLLVALCAVGCDRQGATVDAKAAAQQPVSQRPWPKLRDDLPAPKINIVFILIDTLRADRMSLYGYERETTPFIDSLAEESVVFEDAAAPAPWTLPSVPAVFTSTFSCEHGMTVDGQKISPDLFTLAERLQRVGYSTAQFYANGYAGPTTGMDRGYELSRNIVGKDFVDLAEWFAKRPADRPSLLYLHTVEPHKPHQVSMDYVNKLGDMEEKYIGRIHSLRWKYRELVRVDWSHGDPLGTTDSTERQTTLIHRLDRLKPQHDLMYDAAVLWADDHVRTAITQLRQHHLWDNSLLVLLADHGEELGEHGAYLHSQSVYQELAHVPLMIRFPHGEFGGTRIANTVSLLDVLPTICEILGRNDLAFAARGESLMPLIRGDSTRADEMRITTIRMNKKKYYKPWAQTRGDINVALRFNDWKGIYNVSLETFELYDLVSDPGEQTNVCDQHPELVARMAAFARERYAECLASAHESEVGELTDDQINDLRDLGYVDSGDDDAHSAESAPDKPAPATQPTAETQPALGGGCPVP